MITEEVFDREYTKLVQQIVKLNFNDDKIKNGVINELYELYQQIHLQLKDFNQLDDIQFEELMKEVEVAIKYVHYIYVLYLIQFEEKEEYETAGLIHKICIELLMLIDSVFNPHFEFFDSQQRQTEIIKTTIEIIKNGRN